MPVDRFDWDTPAEGQRFYRTLEEAFGSGARLYVPEPFRITLAHQTNFASAVLLTATAAMLIFK